LKIPVCKAGFAEHASGQQRNSKLKKIKTTFFCQNCGYQSPKWLGKCPSCGEWNRFVEEEIRNSGSGISAELQFNEPPLPIDSIEVD